MQYVGDILYVKQCNNKYTDIFLFVKHNYINKKIRKKNQTNKQEFRQKINTIATYLTFH